MFYDSVQTWKIRDSSNKKTKPALSNEKCNFETPSEPIIPCVKSRELYSVT